MLISSISTVAFLVTFYHRGFQPVLLLANKLDCADGRTVADSEVSSQFITQLKFSKGVEFAQNFDCLLESVSACTSSVEDIDQVIINLIDEIYATDPMAKRYATPLY